MNEAAPTPAAAAAATTAPARPRGKLLRKYFVLFASLVSVTLLANGGIELFVTYREQTDLLIRVQHEQAENAAAKIGQFVKEIESHVGWTTQLPWSAGVLEQRRFDALRLLRQVPAITELSQADSNGREQLRVSRLAMDVIGSQADVSKEPKFAEAMARKIYHGPVYFRRESEPYMTLAMAGTRREAGVSMAEVNLKFIWDVVSQIKVGQRGQAYVVDADGRLIAHPDISLVLRNTDLSRLPQVQAIRSGGSPSDAVRAAKDIQGRDVLTAYAPIAPLGWFVFVELPTSEAYGPLYASVERTGVLLLIALALAGVAAFFLARRMVGPIQALQQGAARIGSGELGHRVEVRTGDELEALADQFNTMSKELHESKERAERHGRLKRFLSPQLANLIESSGNEALLESHRREVAVVFCDLRGFTAFAESASPEDVMAVLGEYHQGLGTLIHKYEGTLERFVGDGLLVLFNDPLPCPDPAARAVRMAVEMQDCVGGLAVKWRRYGHELGFGIGIAQGYATLGRIGFEGRFDYSAIGTVVNLASRLCGEARAGQILVDGKVQHAVEMLADAEDAGELTLKGFQRPVRAYNVRTLRLATEN